MPSAAARAPAAGVPGGRRRALFALLAAQLAMGSGALFGRAALGGASPLFLATARLGAVCLPFLVRLLWLRRPWLGRQRELYSALAAGLLGLQFFVWTQALSRLSVGAITLLTCTTPLWTGLFDVVVRRRRLPATFWLAVATAMVGVAVILVPGGGGDDNTPLGIALGCLCSVVSAGYMQVVRSVGRPEPGRQPVHMLDVVARTYIGAALLLLLPWILVEGAPVPPLDDGVVWGSILGMAAITQGLGHTLQNVSLKALPARLVSAATLIEPLIASVAAAHFFGETLTIHTGIGGMVVLIALAVAVRVSP